MIKNTEKKKVHMNNVHLESEVLGMGSEVGKPSKKNFNIILNSMEHGKDVAHHDLEAEKKEQGDNLKQMGGMS